MKKLLSLSMMVLVAISLSGLLAACSSGKTCGDGTVSQGGKCVPVCADGQYWDGTACAAVPDCGAGTIFNATTGECEPDSSICAAGTELVNGECVPACGTDEYWDGTACVYYPACAPGTSLVNGECVPDVICGDGTHDDGNGNCVPNVLPDADVDEDPEGAVFDLAASGSSISLGGVIDTPDEDGANFDAFVFTADAGTYLDIWATSEGATLPAFLLQGFFDGDDEPDFQRIGLNPNGMDVKREVYLPADGTYVIFVSDYNNMVAMLLGNSSLPVGGPDFTYYVEINTLPAPVPVPLDATALETTPISEMGDFDDGTLRFYSVTNLPEELVSANTMGGAGVIPTLLIFNPDGSLKADTSDSLFLGTSGEYLIVQDFEVVIGPEREVQMDLFTLATPDCSVDDCTAGSVDAGESAVYLVDLLANEIFFHYAMYGSYDIDVEIFTTDGELIFFGESYWFFGDNPSMFSMWAPMDMSLIIRISGYQGEAASFTQSIDIIPESLLSEGDNMGLLTWAPEGYYPAGFDQFTATAGKVVFFTDYNLIDPDRAWMEPATLLMGTDLATYYMAYDPQMGMITPPFMSARTGGRFIHWFMDQGEGAVPGTYDVTMTQQDPGVIAAPIDATPVTGTVTLDATSMYGVLSMDVVAGQGYKVEIVDSQDTVMPQIDVYAYYDLDNDVIAPDATIPTPIASASPNPPRTETGWFQAPYDGELLIVTHDPAGMAMGGEVLDATVTLSACPYLGTRCGNDGTNDIVEICDGDVWNLGETCDTTCVTDENGGHCFVPGDTCADAISLDLSGGDMTIDGDSASATSSFNDFAACTPYGGAGDGPDMWYTFTLDADASLTFEVLSMVDDDSLLALFDDCGNAYFACNDDANGLLSALTADLTAGTYYLLVDSYPSSGGPFQVAVSFN